MGEDYEFVEAYYKFPFSASPEHHSGMATPPLHALASVPFKWEEQPGKPRPCTDIIVRPEPASRGLELPPCRASGGGGAKITRMPSPTTVLDGPYNLSRPRFSSFRMFGEKQSSFDSSSSSGGSPLSQGYGDGKKKLQMSRLFKSRSLRAKKGSLGFSPSPSSFDGDFVEAKMGRGLSHAAPPTPIWVIFSLLSFLYSSIILLLLLLL